MGLGPRNKRIKTKIFILDEVAADCPNPVGFESSAVDLVRIVRFEPLLWRDYVFTTTTNPSPPLSASTPPPLIPPVSIFSALILHPELPTDAADALSLPLSVRVKSLHSHLSIDFFLLHFSPLFQFSLGNFPNLFQNPKVSSKLKRKESFLNGTVSIQTNSYPNHLQRSKPFTLLYLHACLFLLLLLLFLHFFLFVFIRVLTYLVVINLMSRFLISQANRRKRVPKIGGKGRQSIIEEPKSPRETHKLLQVFAFCASLKLNSAFFYSFFFFCWPPKTAKLLLIS